MFTIPFPLRLLIFAVAGLAYHFFTSSVTHQVFGVPSIDHLSKRDQAQVQKCNSVVAQEMHFPRIPHELTEKRQQRGCACLMNRIAKYPYEEERKLAYKAYIHVAASEALDKISGKPQANRRQLRHSKARRKIYARSKLHPADLKLVKKDLRRTAISCFF